MATMAPLVTNLQNLPLTLGFSQSMAAMLFHSPCLGALSGGLRMKGKTLVDFAGKDVYNISTAKPRFESYGG